MGNVGFSKVLLGMLFETSINTKDGSWATTVEHENSYIPNVKSKSEFGSEVGDDNAPSPFFKCTTEYSTDHLAASATVDPFNAEVEFQFASTYQGFSVGAASQYTLRNSEDNDAAWLPPALKAQWKSEGDRFEFGLKYLPKRLIPHFHSANAPRQVAAASRGPPQRRRVREHGRNRLCKGPLRPPPPPPPRHRHRRQTEQMPSGGGGDGGGGGGGR